MITNLNSDFVMECINNATVNKLLEAGKKTGSTDYAVLYYRNKQHPKFFKNKEALKKAIRRIYTLGAFNHREIIEDVLKIELGLSAHSPSSMK